MRTKPVLLLFIIIASCGAQPMSSTFSISYAGRAEGEVLHYLTYAVPTTMPGQKAECDVARPAEFGSAAYSYSCTVTTDAAERETVSDEERWLVQTDETMLTSEGAAIAGSLEKGDAFSTALSVMGWIESEIAYDENYGDVTNACSITLNERRGTCDELSLVALGMLRQLGTPARYVNGIVLKSKWSRHSWVEAAIGGVWVPFDPTFKEHGFVDSRHIAYSKTVDASEPIDVTEGSAVWNHEIDWNVTREDGEIFEVYWTLPEKIPRDGYAIVEARVRNSLENPVGLEPQLFLESGNLPENLELAWSAVPESVAKEARLAWVLKAPILDEKQYHLPVGLKVYDEVLQGEIRLEIEKKNRLEVETDKTHYITGEEARYSVSSSSDGEIVEVESGEVRKGKDAVFILPASGKRAFLSEGAFDVPDAPVRDGYPFDVMITVPAKVKEDSEFQIEIEILGPEREMNVSCRGEDFSVNAPVRLMLSARLKETESIGIEIKSGSERMVLKKTVRVTKKGIFERIMDAILSIFGKH